MSIANNNDTNVSLVQDKNYDYYNYTGQFFNCIPGEEAPSYDMDPYSVSMFETILPQPKPDWEVSLKITAYAVSFLMAVIGNGTLIWIIVTDVKLRTATNALITNLAVSDLMVACTCMWIHLGNSITVEWPFGSFICSGNQFLQVAAVSSSTVTLAAIATERFLVIIFPLRCTGKFNVKAAIAASWAIAILNGIPYLLVRRQYELYWANRHEIWCQDAWPQIFTSEQCDTTTPLRTLYHTYLTVIMFFFPVLIMAVAYAAILWKIRTRIRPGESALSAKEEERKKKLTIMLIVLFAAFVVCWTPRQVLTVFSEFRNKDTLLPDFVTGGLFFASIFLAYFNSALNPLLYAGMSEEFRKRYKRLFCPKSLN